jgi:hypothetical protein
VNSRPANRLALAFLRQAKEPADPLLLFLSQLAWWGKENGVRVLPIRLTARSCRAWWT